MYAELHAQSAFSFLEAASLPEELVATASDLQLPAIAILDTDNLSGAVRFHQAAVRAGIRAHIGSCVTLREGFRLPLLVENRTGYQNLCRLITAMKLGAPKGKAAATWDLVAQHAQGLICLAGAAGGPAPERTVFAKVLETFGRGNVYVEVQRHFHRGQEARTQAAIALARQFRLPLLATNGVNHAQPGRRELLDALTCVRNKTRVAVAGRLLSYNAERHLKPPGRMARLFADHPDAIANTLEVSNRIQFTLKDLGYRFPLYPVAPGETMHRFLRQRTEEGARQRYRPYHDRARQQIERELALIEKLDLAGYFLIVWDLVEFCRRHNILAQGRGSAANSAVCYALGITAVDPVGMDLLFERFLSEERGEWPDIDIDLPSGDQRERVIQYVYQRYGDRGAAMTANVITYRGRSAAREIGKVLGFDEPDLARLASLVRVWEFQDAGDTAERRFRQAGFPLEDPRVGRFFRLYGEAQNLPRHLGQHSGGMVICQGSLDTVVPLEPATMPGRVVIQWDKEDCADAGLIKVDLLGLGMMAVLADTRRLVSEHYGEEIDLAHLPAGDPAVYDALCRADTIGLFQVESRAQMSCLPRLRPRQFYDIVVQVAIIRPGPIVGNLLHPYLRRRQGREPVDYMHPSLQPILERTLGVPLFQEQLLRMAMTAAGFSGGQAEELRRALGFKRSVERMREVEVQLRAGMERNGITGAVQDAIVASITSFAQYGFPESHAASFALIAYASAYLKCHYLAAFTAALLNNQPMGFYPPATIVKDAQRHGLRFRPVDVQASDWLCTLEQEAGRLVLRLGFNYCKGLRKSTGEAIVRERRGGRFASVDELKRRVPGLSKEELKRLAEIGALNSLGPGHRRRSLWEAELALRPAGPLFQGMAAEEGECPLPPMDDLERLRADFQGTGLTIGRHPMAFERERLQAMRVVPAAQLAGLRAGRPVRVAGVVICRQRPGSAKGFLFLSLEDETGVVNAIVTPDFFEQHRVVLTREPILVLDGTLQNQGGAISVKVSAVASFRAELAVPLSHDFR